MPRRELVVATGEIDVSPVGGDEVAVGASLSRIGGLCGSLARIAGGLSEGGVVVSGCAASSPDTSK